MKNIEIKMVKMLETHLYLNFLRDHIYNNLAICS